jgi:spore coat protein U-like protein
MTKTKFILAGLASMLTLIPATQAATVAGNFNVTVSLTSVCTVAAVGNLAFGTYVAFQGAIQNAAPVTATLSCTRGMSPGGITASFDSAAGGSTAAAAATNAVGAGVLAGLQYDITATPGTPVSGIAATATYIGTTDSRPFTIAGSMPAGQAGVATAALATQLRTLTITY